MRRLPRRPSSAAAPGPTGSFRRASCIVGLGLGLAVLLGFAVRQPEMAVGVGGAVAIVGAALIVTALVVHRTPSAPRFLAELGLETRFSRHVAAWKRGIRSIMRRGGCHERPPRICPACPEHGYFSGAVQPGAPQSTPSRPPRCAPTCSFSRPTRCRAGSPTRPRTRIAADWVRSRFERLGLKPVARTARSITATT